MHSDRFLGFEGGEGGRLFGGSSLNISSASFKKVFEFVMFLRSQQRRTEIQELEHAIHENELRLYSVMHNEEFVSSSALPAIESHKVKNMGP